MNVSILNSIAFTFMSFSYSQIKQHFVCFCCLLLLFFLHVLFVYRPFIVFSQLFLCRTYLNLTYFQYYQYHSLLPLFHNYSYHCNLPYSHNCPNLCIYQHSKDHVYVYYSFFSSTSIFVHIIFLFTSLFLFL